jgi:hypothetical protein
MLAQGGSLVRWMRQVTFSHRRVTTILCALSLFLLCAVLLWNGASRSRTPLAPAAPLLNAPDSVTTHAPTPSSTLPPSTSFQLPPTPALPDAISAEPKPPPEPAPATVPPPPLNLTRTFSISAWVNIHHWPRTHPLTIFSSAGCAFHLSLHPARALRFSINTHGSWHDTDCWLSAAFPVAPELHSQPEVEGSVLPNAFGSDWHHVLAVVDAPHESGAPFDLMTRVYWNGWQIAGRRLGQSAAVTWPQMSSLDLRVGACCAAPCQTFEDQVSLDQQ